jgi:hypothetical protein
MASLERCGECISLVRIEARDVWDGAAVVVCVGDDGAADDFTWDS